jgi:hypothetical protein
MILKYETIPKKIVGTQNKMEIYLNIILTYC